MIKVLFVPDCRRWNPYQEALGRSLSRLGVQVDYRISFSQPFSILRELFRVKKCDVLHLHWTDVFIVGRNQLMMIGKSAIFLLELCLAKLMGAKIVWTVHNLTSHEKEYFAIQLFFVRLLLRWCDGLILHCEEARDKMVRSHRLVLPGNVSIIPHGHFVDEYRNDISRESARRALGLSNKETVFLHFGTVRPYKGITEVIDAFKLVEGPQLRLIIVGLPRNETIQKEIEDRSRGDKRILLIFKFVPNDHIQVYMNAADVVVSGFQEILTSGSVLLAMSFGKAVTAPKLGCVPEVLDDNGAILYDPKDERGLEKAMGMAVESDFEAMGVYNLEQARKLDWDEIAEKTSKLYKSLFHTVTTH